MAREDTMPDTPPALVTRVLKVVDEILCQRQREASHRATEAGRGYPQLINSLRDHIASMPREQFAEAPRADATGDLVAKAQRFVTLTNTIWNNTRDGRAAKDLADAEMSRLAGEILAWQPPAASGPPAAPPPDMHADCPKCGQKNHHCECPASEGAPPEDGSEPENVPTGETP
jgi:hypothetical protein